MIADVKVPEVGESNTEGVLVSWSVQDGEVVQAGDALFELETDKITLNVEAKEGGRLQILVQEGEKVEVGQVVAKIDTSAAGEAEEPQREEQRAPAKEEKREKPAPARGEEREDRAASDALSPAVRRLVDEHGLDPGEIEGSGKGGRLTKEDVLRFLQRRDQP
jgi:2-oxoglutarate dehydrogenase E2 component (dihydrolipoamide succinyltransferase)